MGSTFSNIVSNGSLPIWGIFLTALATFAGVVTVFIRGLPDRHRARNEEQVIDNAEMAQRYKEWRDEAHGFKNEIQVLRAQQVKTDQALLAATALNLRSRDDMNSMMFLIRLLISEVKRLDHNPDNIVIQQAEQILEQLARDRRVTDPLKSDALSHAEETVVEAEKTVVSAKHAVVEIHAAEAQVEVNQNGTKGAKP